MNKSRSLNLQNILTLPEVPVTVTFDDKAKAILFTTGMLLAGGAIITALISVLGRR